MGHQAHHFTGTNTYLLHLELDGRFDLINFLRHGLLVGEKTRELASLVQARTQQTRDLLNERLGRQEGIIPEM